MRIYFKRDDNTEAIYDIGKNGSIKNKKVRRQKKRDIKKMLGVSHSEGSNRNQQEEAARPTEQINLTDYQWWMVLSGPPDYPYTLLYPVVLQTPAENPPQQQQQ